MCGQEFSGDKKKQPKAGTVLCEKCGKENDESYIKCRYCRRLIRSRPVRRRSTVPMRGPMNTCPHCRGIISKSDPDHVDYCHSIMTGKVDESKIVYPDECPFCCASTKENGFKEHSE